MVTTVTDNSPQSINTSLFSLDNEVQEVKKTANAINDALAGINIESDVISVNGKQGIVELDASDVDALPSSTVIPTTTSELTNDSGFITSSGSITGNAATATTADKVKNALTINGKTYDGSTAIDAGVQTIANGGTGQTTQAGINKAFVGGLEEGTSDVTDGTMFVSSYASDNGFADTNAVNVPYKRKFSHVWDYIKGKISSVLGLTASNYNGKASTAETADKAINGIYGALGGAKQASSFNFEDLLNNELGNGTNAGLMGGSIRTTTASLGLEAGWWNFLYIPHRTGSGGDNNMYGTLFVTPMTENSGTLYIIHRIEGHNYVANPV